MSAWPEAVWLKKQIENAISVTTSFTSLSQTISGYKQTIDKNTKDVNDFINDNNFWTSIIPESAFNHNMWTTDKDVQVDLQQIIQNTNPGLNGVTVFLTQGSISTELKDSINNKLDNLNTSNESGD